MVLAKAPIQNAKSKIQNVRRSNFRFAILDFRLKEPLYNGVGQSSNPKSKI